MMEWVDKLKSVDGGTIKVVKQDLGIRVGKVDAQGVQRFIWHTTEGYTLPGYGGGAPTIDVGPRVKDGEIITRQLIPFGYMATALQNDAGGIETNRRCIIQVEQVAFTSRDIWLPRKEAVVILASWAAFAKEEFGVPLEYPYNPKDMKSGTWAVETNPWRKSNKFETISGHHPHAAVDENDHWDCGGEDIPEILGKSATASKKLAYQVVAVWRTSGDDPHRKVEAVSPHFSSKKKVEDWIAKDNDSLRKVVRKHLFAGHKIYIADRQVQSDKIQ